MPLKTLSYALTVLTIAAFSAFVTYRLIPGPDTPPPAPETGASATPQSTALPRHAADADSAQPGREQTHLRRADAERAAQPPAGSEPATPHPADATRQPSAPKTGETAAETQLSGRVKQVEAPRGAQPGTAPRKFPPDVVPIAQAPESDRPAETGRSDVCSEPAVGPMPDLSRYTLAQKIGQMLILGFQGTNADEKWPRKVAGQLESGQIGGVLFLKHNIKTKDETKALAALFKASRAPFVPLITIDQEGGLVQRLGPSVGFKRLPSAAQVVQSEKPTQARALYSRTAKVLNDWGFNTNFGPVVDVNVNKNNPVIGRLGRSFSDNPGTVSRYGRAFIEGHHAMGMLTALKHFPGHGSSHQDSHKGFTDISKTWNKPIELAPFKTLIQDNCVDMVMVGHLFLSQYQDKPGGDEPATFSHKLISGVLRHDLGFKGVVISDDMDMGAIRNQFAPMAAILRAITAGNDFLILSNTAKPDVNLPGKVIGYLEARAHKDPELRKRIDASFERIVRLKMRLRALQREHAKDKQAARG